MLAAVVVGANADVATADRSPELISTRADDRGGGRKKRREVKGEGGAKFPQVCVDGDSENVDNLNALFRACQRSQGTSRG